MKRPRILVDADACPVRREVQRVAERSPTEVWYFANSTQDIPQGPSGHLIRVSDKRDAVDFAIVAQCREGDVVVTDDVGLAAMVLAKGARSLSSRGRRFRAEEIPSLLQERHRTRKIRLAGGRTAGPRQLTPADRRRFARALAQLLRENEPLLAQ